jgi:hypothetical protein
MCRLVTFFALVLLVIPLAAQTAVKQPTAKTNSTAATAHTPVHPRNRTAKGRSKTGRTAAATYQLHPDPARYQEIQKALAERGYFKGEANGVWGDDSADAMKRFQTDQKLEPDGKINSLSLVGLGLGARHDGSTAASVSVATPPPVDPMTTVSPAPPPSPAREPN